MAKNKGTAFERYLATIFAQYEREGRATIRKIDPPSLSLGRGKTILLSNPWADFAGTWTEQQGRMIMVEAKHTEKPVLPINRKGGITPKQWESLKMWKASGCAVFIAWEYQRDIRIITPELIQAALNISERVSLEWRDAIRIATGTGFATKDILTTCRHLTYSVNNDT